MNLWNDEGIYSQLNRYSRDILALAEVRWTGVGNTTDEGHKLWYSEDDTKHKHATGFIVNKAKLSSAISCMSVSSRLINTRVAARVQNISIIQVYAPTLEYDEDNVVEEFYEDLKRITKAAPNKDIFIKDILGDGT
ncbi:Hypothetical predicted protein [Octopus vulgaris]|uniref:Craniofacial development protein 2-like n=1 Tax=Octopus vulgaris TaxID=6645 RepID=A0AA36F9D1_OCTVU|nr:Hypothetical predicted protein [Octopus vulgaris]